MFSERSRQQRLQYEFKGCIQGVKWTSLQKQVKKIKIEAKAQRLVGKRTATTVITSNNN